MNQGANQMASPDDTQIEQQIALPLRDSHWIHVGLTSDSHNIHKNEKIAAEIVLQVFFPERTIPVATGLLFLPRCTRFQQDESINLQYPCRFAVSGGCASANGPGLRSKFAIAKTGDASYSWQALTTASHAMCGAAGDETKLLSPGFPTI